MYTSYRNNPNQSVNNPYYSYYVTDTNTPINYSQATASNDDRFLGAAVAPFLLGGITGLAVAPYFWNRPYYYPYPYPYPYYPPYRPFY